MKEGISLIHKSLYDYQPQSIFKFFTYSVNKNENIRTVRKPILCDIPKSNSMNKTIFVNGLYLYNTLPDDIISKNPKAFSKYLNKSIALLFPGDKITRIDPG